MSNTDTIHVGIADDHAIVRRGLRDIITAEADIKVVGEAWDGRSAIELVRKMRVDVLLLDLLMPSQGGLDALAMIRAKSPDTAVLVLSTCPEEHYAAKLIGRGASGYLNKQCEPHIIIEAVRKLAEGGRYITPAVGEAMLRELSPGLPRHPHELLSDREFQLLIRLAKGQVTSQIAEELSLSPKTTSTYRTGLLEKLGLKTNSELTHYAMVHGLID